MYKIIIQTIVITVGLLTISTVSAKLPQQMFACHVSTTTAYDGVVLMQAHNIKDAARGALSAKAQTTNDATAKTVDVKECIKRNGARFSDFQFQQFYESLSEEFK